MSSKSSSSQAQSTTSQDNRQVTDSGAVAANTSGIALSNGALNISGTRGTTNVNLTTDYGLLNAGFDFLKAQDALQAEQTAQILAAHDSSSVAMPYDPSTGAAVPTGNSNLTFTNTQLAIVAGVVALLYVVTRGKGASL